MPTLAPVDLKIFERSPSPFLAKVHHGHGVSGYNYNARAIHYENLAGCLLAVLVRRKVELPQLVLPDPDNKVDDGMRVRLADAKPSIKTPVTGSLPGSRERVANAAVTVELPNGQELAIGGFTVAGSVYPGDERLTWQQSDMQSSQFTEVHFSNVNAWQTKSWSFAGEKHIDALPYDDDAARLMQMLGAYVRQLPAEIA